MEENVDYEQVEGPVEKVSYMNLLSNPVMITACIVIILTGISTEWYQPSFEPYVRKQFGMSSFQVIIYNLFIFNLIYWKYVQTILLNAFK